MTIETMMNLHPLPEEIFGRAFRPLPQLVLPSDAESQKLFYEALERMIHSPAGKLGGDGVAVWALDQSYVHPDGARRESRIVYIEKYSGSIAYRWPRRHLRNLTTDDGSDGNPCDRDNLRKLADQDYNWSFYSRLVRALGPLRIWLATVEELDAVADTPHATAREWERHFNTVYRETYGCLPPKNRRL